MVTVLPGVTLMKGCRNVVKPSAACVAANAAVVPSYLVSSFKLLHWPVSMKEAYVIFYWNSFLGVDSRTKFGQALSAALRR